jgi:tRNA(adenine34) deaminase
MENDLNLMRLALEEAERAGQRDEVPVGAVLVHSLTGEVVTRAGNRSIEMSDPSAHAEMLAIRELCKKIGAQRIPEYDLYVTLEPCAMCAGAISFARIRRVVFGAQDLKGGAVVNGPRFYEQPTCHHRPQITGGVLDAESAIILKTYFKGKR